MDRRAASTPTATAVGCEDGHDALLRRGKGHVCPYWLSSAAAVFYGRTSSSSRRSSSSRVRGQAKGAKQAAAAFNAAAAAAAAAQHAFLQRGMALPPLMQLCC
jgi:hypothetical protein